MDNEIIPGVSEELMKDTPTRVKELMENNIKLTFNRSKEVNRDKEHLEFIFARLLHVYHENENFDYMIRFKKIIDGYDR